MPGLEQASLCSQQNVFRMLRGIETLPLRMTSLRNALAFYPSLVVAVHNAHDGLFHRAMLVDLPNADPVMPVPISEKNSV